MNTTWSKWLEQLRTACRGSRPRNKRGKTKRPTSLTVESLEDRSVPAVLFVDNPGDFVITTDQGAAGLDNGDTVTWNAGAGSQHSPSSVSGLAFGINAFGTIQGAVNAAASSGDTIRVAGGTFSELVTVNKSVVLLGNQTGNDARTRTSTPETVVDGAVNGSNKTTAFYITAANATIDGFTVRDQTDPNVFNAGIVMGPSGVTIRNNIITNNVIGIFANSSGTSLIERNLIDGNNNPGPAGGAGIYTESTTNLTIDNNEFRNQTENNPIIFAAVGANAHNNLIVSNNFIHDNVSGIFALGITGGVFEGNTITTGGTATALTFGGANTGIDVLRNDISGNARGLRIADFGFFGATPNSDIEAHYNVFSNNSQYGAGISDEGSSLTDGYTGSLDLSANWWGDVTGPASADNPGGAGTVLRNDFADTVDFQPWLLYGDDDSTQVGFQIPTSFTITAQTTDFTATNNNYRRLVNAFDPLVNGQTVILTGTFDWTESNALASWALGNDGVASTADDYSLLIKPTLNGVTATATSLGSARIQGPGDLADANLEGVFVFDGGDNQNWTISNLEIYDFDLGIGMFFGAGGTDAFNNTTITNNHIRIATDLNAVVAPTDVNQNIGIHYSFGTNQTISNNLIEIPGDGVSDPSADLTSNRAAFSTTVGMQSNTSGGSVYNGLQIMGNVIHILNAQDATNPQRVIGIWENGHAHTSDITLSGNQFLNDVAANDPTNNLQQAFWITSHSSATTTATYSGNTVQGANIGFKWLGDPEFPGTDFSGNQAVRLVGNTITNSNTGVLIQSNGVANLFQNTIAGSGSGGAVHVITGMLTGTGSVTNAVQENVISGGTGDGILIDSTAGSIGSIFNNDLSGNTGLAINNQSGSLVDASGNWYGTNTAAGVAGEVSSNVDYTPWLDSGTDTSATGGFQGDFSTLHVDDSSPQTGSTGRIQEGIDLATGSTPTVIVEAGTYAESIAANKSGLTLDGVTDNATDVVIAPLGSADGITVTANNVTIRDLSVTGAASAIVASNVTPLTLVNLQLIGNTSGGTLTNVATLDFTASPAADTITVSGTQFDATNFQAIGYTGVTSLTARGGTGADTFNITPPSAGGTHIAVDGGAPTSAPGDVLNFDAQGGSVTDDGDTLTSTGFEPVDYTNIETTNLLNATGGLVVNGTTAADTLRLFVDSVLGPVYQLNGGPVTALGGGSSFAFNGLAGADAMIVDASNGDPIPVGNVFFVGDSPTSGPGDRLEVIGNGSDVGFYNPSATTPGDGNVQVVGKGSVIFTGLEPTTVSGFSLFTFVSPNSDDVLTIDSSVPGQNRISGTSGGVAFEALSFFDVATFILDTGANDGALPHDQVTLDASGLVATGLQNFIVATGAGNDSFTVNATNYSTPASGGGLQFQGGSGADTFFGNADIDYTLADGGVTSSAGGSVSFGSIEFADLTGGADNNTFTVTGWTKTASLHGNGETSGVGDRVLSVNDEDYTLSATTLIRNGATFLLDGIETADLTGDDSTNTFNVTGWTGQALLDGAGAADAYNITFGGTGSVSIADSGSSGMDAAVLTGSGASETYAVTPTQTGNGSFTVTYDGELEQLTLNAGSGDDDITLTPSADTAFFINGQAPTTLPGDSLTLDLTGVTNINLTTGATGEGQWTLGNRQSVTYTGIETVGPVVTITANDASAGEHTAPASPNPGQFTVTRTGDTASALTVNYSVSGTATNGTDYTLLTGNVTIPAGQASAVIDITVINDALTEGSETVTLTVAPGFYAIGASNSDTVTIADNEPEIRITASDPSAGENFSPGANPGQFIVTRTGATSSALTVNYTVSGTATNGADYATLSGSVVIGAGQSSAVIDVGVINDALTEGNETVTLTLAAGAYTIASPTEATVTIADNEPEVSIVANDPNASEQVAPSSPNPGQFTVTRTGDTASALTVNYSVSGTATNGTDYTLLTGNVTIPAGAASAVINVNVTNDGVSEGNETVIVALTPDAAYTLTNATNATVTIINSAPVIANQSFTVPENSPNGTVVGQVVASDSNGDPRTFSIIGGNTSGAFAINPTTGQITVANSAALDFETKPVFPLTVRVSDGQVSTTATVTVNLLNVIEAPPAPQPAETAAALSIFAVSAAPGSPTVLVYNAPSGTLRFTLAPFGTTYTGPIQVATGDVTGDGTPDVIAGAAVNGHVKVFSGANGAEVGSFFTFPGFNGGITVAAGDINGDGKAEVIAGAAVNGHVKVFSGAGFELRSFLAYPGFTGGVNVAAGDINGDGKADIITGSKSNGHVKVFDGVTNAEIRSFFAFTGFPGEVTVAAGDVNADGKSDIIVGAGPGAGPHVKVFSGADNSTLWSFFAFDSSFKGGIRVGTADLDGDGLADILAIAGSGAAPHVKGFDGQTLAELDSFMAVDPAAGISVS